MKVILGCEKSGVIRRAFRDAGHWCLSIDTEAAWDPEYAARQQAERMGGHWQGDLFDVLQILADEGTFPDIVIVHPECRFISSSGMHRTVRGLRDPALTDEALRFVERCWRIDCPRLCLENPRGVINTRLPFMPRPQWIQPHLFGDDASKTTGLWLRGLPPLVPTGRVPPRLVCSSCGMGYEFDLLACPACGSRRARPRHSNQTDSGQNRLSPGPRRSALRAQTYPGVALAMAAQWGRLPPLPRPGGTVTGVSL